jgi:hypothetical protein
MAIDTIKSTAVLDGAISTADLANDIAINTSGAITTTGAFTSKGIDDNADATALTITSDEEVLIGKTTDAQQTAGTALYPSGQIYNTASGTHPLVVTRKTNDGAIALFYKDTNEVGRIGTVGNQSYIHGAGTDVGIYFGSNNLYPYRSTGLNDATIDLGQSAKRFKDAYLSGGIYLGGTGAVNKLDDYEEGTWSPTLSFGGGSTGIVYGTQSATYTKIGNVVNFAFRMYLTNKGSSTGHARVNGLPFAVGGMPTGGVFTLLPARGRIGASSRPMFVYILNGDSSMLIYRCDWDNSINAGADNSHFSNNSEVELVGQYTTNS